MLTAYPVIFFDAGGTLLHPYPSVGAIYHKIALRHGCEVDPKQIEDQFRKIWCTRDGLSELRSHSSEKVERAWWRSLVEEVFKDIASFHDFEIFFDELYDVFARPESWKVYPEVLEVLKHLKAKGKRMAIISNWDSRLFHLCEGLKLNEYFDFVLASAVFGASKPGPKIFEEALSKMGVSPDLAIHIGDSVEDDIRGARAVGMRAVWINRHPDIRKSEAHAEDGVHIVHSLAQLIT